MRRVLLFAVLCMIGALVFGSTAGAQGTSECPVGTGLTESGECVPLDDRCPPGMVFYEGAGSASGSCVPGDIIPGTAPATATATATASASATASATASASATATAEATEVAEEEDATGGTGALPETGGLSALSFAALAMLIVGGLFARRLV